MRIRDAQAARKQTRIRVLTTREHVVASVVAEKFDSPDACPHPEREVQRCANRVARRIGHAASASNFVPCISAWLKETLNGVRCRHARPRNVLRPTQTYGAHKTPPSGTTTLRPAEPMHRSQPDFGQTQGLITYRVTLKYPVNVKRLNVAADESIYYRSNPARSGQAEFLMIGVAPLLSLH